MWDSVLLEEIIERLFRFVPREDYAEVRAFIEQRPRRRSQRDKDAHNEFLVGLKFLKITTCISRGSMV